MRNFIAVFCRFTLGGGVILTSALAQNQDVPNQPFQAVHLITVKSPDAEKALSAAIGDYNQAIAKTCKKCIYHLWKGNTDQSGSRLFLWTSSWPGRDIYVKVHSSSEYLAAEKKHSDLGPIMEKEIYDRYIELKTGK